MSSSPSLRSQFSSSGSTIHLIEVEEETVTKTVKILKRRPAAFSDLQVEWESVVTVAINKLAKTRSKFFLSTAIQLVTLNPINIGASNARYLRRDAEIELKYPEGTDFIRRPNDRTRYVIVPEIVLRNTQHDIKRKFNTMIYFD